MKSLLQLVELKNNADLRLRILVENVFSKVVISKTYAEAMEVAKNNNLTCITSDY